MPLRKLAKSLFSVVLTLLSLEALVRGTNMDGQRMDDPFARGPVLFRMFIPDAYLGWRNRPWMHLDWSGIVLNGLGHRGPEIRHAITPGVRRIAILGDSCTFGIISTAPGRFEMPRPYAEVLQRLLDEKMGAGRFEVINYGTIGYTTYHGVRLLRKGVFRDDPDYVVIRFGWNDHLASPVDHSLANVRNPWLERLDDLAFRSRLFAMIRYSENMLRLPSDRPGFRQSAHPVVWVAPGDYAWNLSRMIDLVRAHGARPVLLDAPAAPLSPQIRSNGRYLRATGYETFQQVLAAHGRYQEITARVAREKGVPFLRSQAPPGEAAAFFSPYDLPHPNAAGHARIARVLYEEIVSEEKGRGAR